MAPLRKVGPRLRVMLENQMMNTPKATHCGPFLRILSESLPISSGSIGVLSSTQVSRLICKKELFFYLGMNDNACLFSHNLVVFVEPKGIVD